MLKFNFNCLKRLWWLLGWVTHAHTIDEFWTLLPLENGNWAILSNHTDCFYLHPEHDSEAYNSKFFSVLRLITIQGLTALLLRTSILALRETLFTSQKKSLKTGES